jgi:hypothetical protein
MSKFLVKSIFLALSLAFVPSAQAELSRADLLRVVVTDSTTVRFGKVARDKKGEKQILTEKALDYKPFLEGDSLFVVPNPVKLKGKTGSWYKIVEIEHQDSGALTLYTFLTMKRDELTNQVLDDSARKGVGFYIRERYVVTDRSERR